MKKPNILIPVTAILIILFMGVVQAQTKLAQTGYQFLSIGQDSRAEAMGGAFTTVEGASSAMFYNPAGLARIESQFDLSLNYFEFIADIKHASLSLAFNPLDGQYGVFGLSIQSVDYGDIEGTIVASNPVGYLDTEIMNPRALMVGFGYGKLLSEKFSVGGNIKFVTQQLGKSLIPGEGVKKNLTDVLAFDFGTVYHTGFRSLAFGMSVRNFSKEIKYEREGFQLPLVFKIGFSVNAFDFVLDDLEDQSLQLVFDAGHPRSQSEFINFGGEYRYRDFFSLRIGYTSAQDEYGMGYGFGVSQYGLQIDYGYTPFGVFDSVHRFSVKFAY